jgi:hypothetical protein
MVDVNHQSFRPYYWYIFWRSFLVLIFALVISNVTIFIIRSNYIFAQTQEDLKIIATKVASRIPVEMHERLISPDQGKSSDYQTIQTYFWWVMDGNPNIDDIYTLRPTDQPDTMTFVVSGQVTKDKNGDNYLEDFERKPVIGEKYNITGSPELRNGLLAATSDSKITYDKWGSWISGYAPLKDNSGKTVAIVGVDIGANFISNLKNELMRAILLADILVLPIILGMSLLLAWRLSKPFRILARGMARIRHGDYEYLLPLKHKAEEGIFVDLFNDIRHLHKEILDRDKRNQHAAENKDLQNK